MYEIGKIYEILDKEDRLIVSSQIPYAIFSVKFKSKSSDVANGVRIT